MTLAAFAAAALSAQAAAVNWGIGADVYLAKVGEGYESAVLASEASFAPADGSYLALVYVGQNQDSFVLANITAESVVATSPFALDPYDGGCDWSPAEMTADVTDTATYPDGASFAVVWFDKNTGAFDYIYSIDDGSALNSATTFSDMTRGNDYATPAATTTGFGGVLYVTVPEPGIAAMALIGLGMMIKRRRA